MFVTLDGIFKLSTLLQKKNAYLAMLVTPSGITTSFSEPLYFNNTPSELIEKSLFSVDIVSFTIAVSTTFSAATTLETLTEAAIIAVTTVNDTIFFNFFIFFTILLYNYTFLLPCLL